MSQVKVSPCDDNGVRTWDVFVDDSCVAQLLRTRKEARVYAKELKDTLSHEDQDRNAHCVQGPEASGGGSG